MFYDFLWWTLKLFLGVPFRLTFLGRERVPREGGIIIASNHESYVDPVILAMGLPLDRKIHFMAKAELWKNGVVAYLVEAVGTFPVQRGAADRAAIQFATGLLEKGEVVGIFPQGTRHHPPGLAGLEEGAGGTALIAMRSGAAVVPVGIYGNDRIIPEGARFVHFPRLVVAYGEPIRCEDIPEGPRRERMEAMTARIMEGIGAAMAEAAAAAGEERGA
jgi:1-acyl-sn-glycerol-3-phosphate acyltransferase